MSVAFRDQVQRVAQPFDFLKTALDKLIPFFLFLYAVSLLTSMSGMEIFGWGTCLLTVLYILGSLLVARRPRVFTLGCELPLLGLLIVAGLGLYLNAPDADHLAAMGKLRWVVMLYLLAYALALQNNLNRILNTLMIVGTIVACYAIFQHFTGIDLIRGDNRSVTIAPFAGATVYQNTGFLSHHLTYGYSFGMLICFPLAALLLGRRRPIMFRLLCTLSVLLIGLSLLWTYGRGVWMATALAFFVLAAYVSKRHLVAFLVIIGIIGGVLYTGDSGFQERFASMWASNYTSNTDRQDLWRANLAMFQDYPWLGVGYGQNEEILHKYYDKLDIANTFGGHAHNNYLQMLSTTGLLGMICYMLFILSFLLTTHRLWMEVPKTHYWHRVLVLGALGAQVTMHAGGVTQWNFGDAEVNHLFIFILAMIGYLSERYSRGIVPDDYAL
ncbi:MAG TPA: O-antigen ligase family protein [Bdellovibrionales bacterium]|nr:O-antigen ligase family protein [Bdellovibrionales bacterium]